MNGETRPKREALAVAFALKSIENGYGAYFVRDYDLMKDLRRQEPSTDWTGVCVCTSLPGC